MKCVKTFISCKWGINFLTGFFLRDIRNGNKKNRHRWFQKQSRCVLYRKRQKPLGRKLPTLLMIWVKSRSYTSYTCFVIFIFRGEFWEYFDFILSYWISILTSDVENSSDIWLAASFLNLLNNNLSKASLKIRFSHKLFILLSKKQTFPNNMFQVDLEASVSSILNRNVYKIQ